MKLQAKSDHDQTRADAITALADEDQIVEFDTSPALRAVGRAGQALIDADRHLIHAVAGARAAGHSWTEIGTVLGVSRQAARQRFEVKVAAEATPAAE